MPNKKNKSGGNIPALRFPEFKEEWEIKNLGDLGEFKGGGTPTTINNLYWNGTIPWVSSSDLIEGDIRLIKINRYITNKAINDSATKIIPPKSILIVSRVGVGKVAVNDSNICTSQDFQSLILNQGNYIFLAYLIQLKTIKLLEFNQGTSIKGFVKSDLANLEISLPSLPEQQKIAAFLTAVDDKIQLLTRKKQLLEQYKKGCMQQIFSQAIRFKDDNGKAYPDWEEKKLGEVVTFYQTNSYSRSLLNYNKGTVKNIHYGDIHTKFNSLFDIKIEKVPFINNDIDLSKLPEEQFCKEGDLIIADASEDYKDIGKAIEIINLDKQKLIAGLHTYIARDKDHKTASGFKGYLFQSEHLRLQMMKMATGISVLGISKGNLAKLEIGLPNFEEQQKIANFLSTIDTKINLVNTQLQQTRQFKKGLLQQMFV